MRLINNNHKMSTHYIYSSELSEGPHKTEIYILVLVEHLGAQTKNINETIVRGRMGNIYS